MNFATVQYCASGSRLIPAGLFFGPPVMSHSRAGAPPRAFAVDPAFDDLDGSTAHFVRLVRAGHVFCADDGAYAVWPAPAIRTVRTAQENGDGR